METCHGLYGIHKMCDKRQQLNASIYAQSCLVIHYHYHRHFICSKSNMSFTVDQRIVRLEVGLRMFYTQAHFCVTGERQMCYSDKPLSHVYTSVLGKADPGTFFQCKNIEEGNAIIEDGKRQVFFSQYKKR